MFAKTLFFYCKKILIALIFIKKIYKFASIDTVVCATNLYERLFWSVL